MAATDSKGAPITNTASSSAAKQTAILSVRRRSGGELVTDLTLPKLRGHWRTLAGYDPLSAAELPAPVVRA
jgi:hypothetical protein